MRLSKLLYNLHSLWLSTGEAQKVDAFQIKCLRRILKIQPSFYSHVTNSSVLQKAGARPMTLLLLERQLKWLGKIARRHDSDILKQSIFGTSGGPLQPREPAGPRKRGRPKISWIKGVLEHATAAAGSRGNLIALLSSSASEFAWNKTVYGYCRK